jgi:hypothetical protein
MDMPTSKKKLSFLGTSAKLDKGAVGFIMHISLPLKTNKSWVVCGWQKNSIGKG